MRQFNAFVGNANPTQAGLEEFIDRLGGIVPPAAVRAAIWGAMLAGTSDADLRNELLLAAGGLRGTVENGTSEPVWTKAAAEGLKAAADASGDTAIGDLLQSVEGDTHPLLGIAAWAERLQTISSSPLDEPAPQEIEEDSNPPAAEMTVSLADLSAEPPIDVPTPNAVIVPTSEGAGWVLRKILGNIDFLAASVNDVRTLTGRMGALDPLEDPESVLAALTALEDLQTEIRLCLAQVPPRAQLEHDFNEGAQTHALARSLLGEDFDPSQNHSPNSASTT